MKVLVPSFQYKAVEYERVSFEILYKIINFIGQITKKKTGQKLLAEVDNLIHTSILKHKFQKAPFCRARQF